MGVQHLVFAALSTALFAGHVNAACTGPLLVDDFSLYNIQTNKLGMYTNDDGSFAKASASGGTLSFTTKNDSSSYFYETFGCQSFYTNGYTAISFSFKGPVGGTIGLELQSQTNCSSTDIISSYVSVDGITGQTQTITAKLSQFVRSNLDMNVDAITSLVFGDFSGTTNDWQLGKIQFECGNAPVSSSSSSTSITPTSTSTTAKISTSTSTTVPASTSTTTSSSIKTSTSLSTTISKTTSKNTLLPPGPSLSVTRTVIGGRAAATLKARQVLSPRAAKACANLLIDDFSSQSRLTFLFYNALYEPTSDDGSMNSVVVGTPSRNHVTLTPKDGNSYWFTQFGCINAENTYGGISLRIKAAKGTTFSIELQSSTSCDSENNSKSVIKTNSDLGWTFDGTEKLYSIPFSKFTGIGIKQLVSVNFAGVSKVISFGPIAFYCGDTPSEYPVPTTVTTSTPLATVPITKATASALVIDTFKAQDSNNLGFWRGADEGMTLTYGTNKVTVGSTDTDFALYTQLGNTCTDITKYDLAYLHIAFTGSSSFTVALQQHNKQCSEEISPYPETWDSLSAARYVNAAGTDLYIPMSHFNINRTRAIGLAIKGFYPLGTTLKTTFTRIEIVPTAPSSLKIPAKLPNGKLVFACSRPNSFAFAIDDGDPAMAQQVLSIIREENIKVTFFTVGMPLLDPSTNLTNVYREMRDEGHQIALHSYTHPKMEGLSSTQDIDWEYDQDIKAVKQQLGLESRYFRPPFGTEGARMRERLAAKIQDPFIVNWSVDVEDWLWAESTTPEKQLEAFQRDVDKGGNLVVMHYLYPSTVNYLKQFVQIARKTGKQLMRVDQCMEDPAAPPLST